MRKQILGLSMVAVVAWAIAGEPAYAQPEAEPASPVAPATPAPRPAASPAEQVEQSAGYLAEMEAVRSRVQGELERARKERDVVKTLCLNDKLNQIDVAIGSAAERRRALELAVKRGDAELASHEYTILAVLHQRVLQLDSEANQCIGKEVAFVGESAVTVDVEGGMPLEDPAAFPPTPALVQPPSCASCYR
jgi:hypothetical protein